MKNKKFASFLAAAAALVLLAMPAFAADEQTELPAAEAAEVQQEQTAAPAEQETALPADAQTAGEPEQQLTYVALGDSITSGVGLADMKYNIAQIGYDLQPNFEGYPSQCYTALVGKGLGLDRQHAINLGLPGLMSPDMLDMVQNSAMPKMNQASGAYYVYPEYQEYLRKADIISIQIGQVPSRKVDILTLNYGDGRQLPVLFDGFLFVCQNLFVDSTVALDECELAIFVFCYNLKLFHNSMCRFTYTPTRY